MKHILPNNRKDYIFLDELEYDNINTFFYGLEDFQDRHQFRYYLINSKVLTYAALATFVEKRSELESLPSASNQELKEHIIYLTDRGFNIYRFDSLEKLVAWMTFVN
jgi:hypothetical protein